MNPHQNYPTASAILPHQDSLYNHVMPSKFKDKIIEIARLIPKGTVVSYGQVALMAGVPRAARQVGWVLHEYSEKYQLPWWRVINSVGRISTNCLEHTADMQSQLLISEGIKVTPKLTIAIEKYRFRPNSAVIKSLELDSEYIFLLTEKYQL